jgi:hypothetical protein
MVELPMENLPLSKISETKVVTRLKILRYIAEHGAANKYLIRKESGAGSQPTVLATVDDLEKTREIMSRETNVHARGNRPSKLYDLTVPGLANLITGIVDYADALDGLAPGMGPVRYLKKGRDTSPPINVLDATQLLSRVAEKYGGLMPEVFELWQGLRDVGLDRNAELAVFCHLLLMEHERGELANERELAKWLRENSPMIIGIEVPQIIRLERYRAVPVKKLQRNREVRKAAFEYITGQVKHLRFNARDVLKIAMSYEKLAKRFGP